MISLSWEVHGVMFEVRWSSVDYDTFDTCEKVWAIG